MEVLVARDGGGKAAFTQVVDRKGGSGEGVARAVAEDPNVLSTRRILLKGDQDPALKEPRSKSEDRAGRRGSSGALAHR